MALRSAQDEQREQLERGLAVAALGFGAVATLTPRVFTGVYGLGGDPGVLGLARLWGTRTAVLGGLALAADDEARGAMMPWLAGMNLADAVLTARADGISARTRTLGTLSSLAFAGAMGWCALQRRAR